MKVPDYKELYKPYEGKATLEETIAWVLRECKQKGINRDLGKKAINLTFLEMAQGKTYPTDGGDTEFKGYPHAVMNHAVMKKAIELHNKSVEAYLAATEGELQARIQTYVSRNKNREYWNHLKRKSPVTRGIITAINLTAGKDKEWISTL